MLGEDKSNSILSIPMLPDGGCLPGLPSLTFQCSVTNNLHVQSGMEEHRKFPTVHEVVAALCLGMEIAYYHSESPPLVLHCCHERDVFSLDAFSSLSCFIFTDLQMCHLLLKVKFRSSKFPMMTEI